MVYIKARLMAKRTLTVSEARKQLPRLIHEVARGGGPFYFGARGQATAVLVSAADYDLRATAGVVSEALGAWEPLRVEIVGSPEDLENDIREIRDQAVASSVESWDRQAAQAARVRPRGRKRVQHP
jgi:PHD/YefM family antitoxin component YafN of YafNO toxin-antitoxin module